MAGREGGKSSRCDSPAADADPGAELDVHPHLRSHTRTHARTHARSLEGRGAKNATAAARTEHWSGRRRRSALSEERWTLDDGR